MHEDIERHIKALRCGPKTRFVGDGSDNFEIDSEATAKIMSDAATFLCAVSDPENQPNQFGLSHLAPVK